MLIDQWIDSIKIKINIDCLIIFILILGLEEQLRKSKQQEEQFKSMSTAQEESLKSLKGVIAIKCYW